MTRRRSSKAETAERAKHAEENRSLRALRFLLLVAFFSVSPSAFAQQTHVLVVTGVPGDEEHAKKFAEWANTFIDAAKKKEAVPDANITLLSDRNATKASVEKAFTDIAAKAVINGRLRLSPFQRRSW